MRRLGLGPTDDRQVLLAGQGGLALGLQQPGQQAGYRRERSGRISRELFEDSPGFQQVLFSAAMHQQDGLQASIERRILGFGGFEQLLRLVPLLLAAPRGQQRGQHSPRTERARVDLQHAAEHFFGGRRIAVEEEGRASLQHRLAVGIQPLGLLVLDRRPFSGTSALFFSALPISSYPWASTKARSAADILTFF